MTSPDPVVVARLRAAGCVFAEEEAALLVAEGGTTDELEAMVARRVAGHPLEQVLGWAEFCGLRITVSPGVFVPRRRTRLMVREAVRLLEQGPAGQVVVDLCCGTGAVGLAVAAAHPEVELHACDVDPDAVRCARANLGERGRVHEGDLDRPLPASLRGRVRVMLANVPYVPTDEIALLPAEARLHEHRVALDGGTDGLETLARVAALAPRWLASGGSVLCETSERQAPRAVQVFEGHGLAGRVVGCDEATVVVGTLSGGAGEGSVLQPAGRQRLAERVGVPKRPHEEGYGERARARTEAARDLGVAHLLGEPHHDRDAPDPQRDQQADPLGVDAQDPQRSAAGHHGVDQVRRARGHRDQRGEQHQHDEDADHDDRPRPAVHDQVEPEGHQADPQQRPQLPTGDDR
jgi:release factor glutamine methyltransferase